MISFIYISYGRGPIRLTSNDWSAVFLVCKHMKNLKKLYFGRQVGLSEESDLGALRLLEQRCVEELALRRPRSGHRNNRYRMRTRSRIMSPLFSQVPF